MISKKNKNKKTKKKVFTEIETIIRPNLGDLKKKRSSLSLDELQNKKTPLFWSK